MGESDYWPGSTLPAVYTWINPILIRISPSKGQGLLSSIVYHCDIGWECDGLPFRLITANVWYFTGMIDMGSKLKTLSLGILR